MPTVRRASVQENRSTCSLRSRSSSNEYIVRLLGGWTEVAFAFSFCSFVAIGSVHESAANKRLENPQGENLIRRELVNVICDDCVVDKFGVFGGRDLWCLVRVLLVVMVLGPIGCGCVGELVVMLVRC